MDVRRTKVSVLAAVSALTLAALTACSNPSTTSTPTPTGSETATASATPTPTVDPTTTLRPLLSADENRAFFDSVNKAVIAANSAAGGRDFIDALVAAGFDKAAMQVTVDTTSAGEVADSVQWSVLWAEECLIGQYGPKSDGYHSMIAAPAGNGSCLLGAQRPIDW